MIVRYADFIEFPDLPNDGRQPVNRLYAPWHIDGTELEYADYLLHRYGVAPLALEPITADDGDLHLRGVLLSRRARSCSGVIFVPSRFSKDGCTWARSCTCCPSGLNFVYAIVESFIA